MKKIKIVLTSIFFLLISIFGFSLSVFAADGSLGKFNYPKKEEGSLDTNMFVRSAFMYKYSSGSYRGDFLVAAKKNSGDLKFSKSGYTPTISILKDYNPFSISAEKKKILKSDYGWTDNEIAQLDNYQFAGASTAYSSEWAQYVSFDCDVQRNMDYKDWICTGLELLKPYLIDPEKFDPNINLIPPKFYLKTHNDNGLNKYTEYTLTWITKGSFVEGYESEYGFKVFIGKERKPLKAKELEATKYSPCKFTEDKLVFTWENVKDLFSFLSTSSLENRFDVFIQITDKTGKAVSDNYIHFLVIKRVEIRESDYVDKNGNIKISYGKWENGQFKYTDGRDTSSEDNSTNSNGSSTAPGSKVSNDDYTDISNAPSYSQIDASATSSLIKTLDTIVSSVSNVPALLAKVYAWLPYQIITLIGTAIGLIVVVGIIKWVL